MDVIDIAGNSNVSIQEFVFKGSYAKYNGGRGARYWIPLSDNRWMVNPDPRRRVRDYIAHTNSAWNAYRLLYGE